MQPPRILISVDGGCVTAVVTDAGFPLPFVVVDYDVDGSEDCHEIPQTDGSTELAHLWSDMTEVSPEFVRKIHALTNPTYQPMIESWKPDQPRVNLADRESILAWLQWNDNNGCYTDDEADRVGVGRFTLEDAQSVYRTVIAESRELPCPS